jgi:hypothetical protein
VWGVPEIPMAEAEAEAEENPKQLREVEIPQQEETGSSASSRVESVVMTYLSTDLPHQTQVILERVSWSGRGLLYTKGVHFS